MVHTHLAMQIISSHYNDSFSVIPSIGSRWVFDTKDPFNQIVVQVTNCKRGYVEIGHIIDINGKQELGTFIRRSLLSSDFVKFYNPENSDKACANRMGVSLEDYQLFKKDQEEFEQELYDRERYADCFKTEPMVTEALETPV